MPKGLQSVIFLYLELHSETYYSAQKRPGYFPDLYGGFGINVLIKKYVSGCFVYKNSNNTVSTKLLSIKYSS